MGDTAGRGFDISLGVQPALGSDARMTFVVAFLIDGDAVEILAFGSSTR